MDIEYIPPGNKHLTKMWLDLENVSIPRDLQQDYVFRRIKHSLDLRGFHGSLEIKAIVAEDKSKMDIKDVDVVSMGLSGPRLNAADGAIVNDIVAFCLQEKRRTEPVNILIASGDKKVMQQAYSKSRRRQRTIVWLGVSVDTIEDPMPEMKALWTWRKFLLMKEEAPPKVPKIEYDEMTYRNVGPLPWSEAEMKEQVKKQKLAAKFVDSSEESEEEEETAKKPEPINKKRQNESTSSVPGKKAKPAATPQKTEEKTKGGHTATPHPAKKGGKSPVNANQSPKSGGQSSGGNNKKPSNSEEEKKGGHTATPHPAKKGGKSPVNANQSPKSGGQSSGGNNKKPFNSGK